MGPMGAHEPHGAPSGPPGGAPIIPPIPLCGSIGVWCVYGVCMVPKAQFLGPPKKVIMCVQVTALQIAQLAGAI